MRLSAFSLGAAALGTLAACAGNGISPGPATLAPQYSNAGVIAALSAPDAARGGLYVSQFNSPSILGYKSNNKKNGAPTCSISGVQYLNGVAVDGKGNVIDPDGGSRSIIIFKGPGMCGANAASTSDPYGQPVDAASNNALKDKIAVANMMDTGSKPGSVSVCTMKGGCKSNLTNSAIFQMVGVAMDTKGNCWASAYNRQFLPALVYFAKCKGAGVSATGYQNTSPGGLDIDKAGNLVAIDTSANNIGALWVYSGCKPDCTLVGGPFALHGETFWGHLNENSTAFATANYVAGEVDVYQYSPTALTFLYSFTNGLTPSDSVKGAAYNPRSKE
ncbi:MAG TPA: hypothetical protein VHX17_10875 [Candidatus Cybelea sp.]|nr:hypothetical protein [Candidatus Cybelea sp.]